MPKIKKGESKKKYISRCIQEVMNEGGHTPEQAAGKCYGMWEEQKKKSKGSIIQGNDETLIE